jgi:hypothetical protein
MAGIYEKIISVNSQYSGQIGTFNGTNTDSIRRLYYAYGLNKKFGVLPQYLESVDDFDIFSELCFFLVNCSITLYDFSESVETLHNLYKSGKSTETLFNLTKDFYKRMNLTYNDTNYSPHFSIVFDYFNQQMFEGSLLIYVSYLKGKLAFLHRRAVTNVNKKLATNSIEYQENKAFLEKIRNKFFSYFSNNNEKLLEVADIFDFKVSLQKSLSFSTIKSIRSLETIKDDLFADVSSFYYETIDSVFNDSATNSFYNFLLGKNVLSVYNLSNYMHYMQEKLKQL